MPASWAYASDCGTRTRATESPPTRSPGAIRSRTSLSRGRPAARRGSPARANRPRPPSPGRASHHEPPVLALASGDGGQVRAPGLVAADDGESRSGTEPVKALPDVA